jgi:hypothetical protein
VADGWVALLHPLTPGTHTITLDITGEFPGVSLPIHQTTTIIVKPGHWVDPLRAITADEGVARARPRVDRLIARVQGDT